jgi:acetylglutamate/LysW-gamma-L-alpha-aminoadipate kinase
MIEMESLRMNAARVTGVVKIGGARGNSVSSLVRDIAGRVRSGERWVLVHGASSQMEDLCTAAGIEPVYVTSPSGYRSRFVGDREMALFLAACGTYSLGITEEFGECGLWGMPLYPGRGTTAVASRKDILRSQENGRVRLLRGNRSGSIVSFDAAPVRRAWNAGAVPLLPPLAADVEGVGALNVDGDRMAASAASALGADVLVILSNVPGLLRDGSDPDSLVCRGGLDDWDALESYAKGNMKRKLLAAKEALLGGVPRAIIADSRVEEPLSEALAGRGTELCPTSMAAVV